MERPVKIKCLILKTPSTKSYTLKCDWYDKCFSSIDELIEDCLSSGMDPNYDVLEDNKSTGMKLIDYIQP